MSNSEKTLNRLPDEAMIGGVCAGVADRFDLDVALVRAAFAGLTVFSGFGIVAYIVLWYLLDPPAPADDEQLLVIDGPAAEPESAALSEMPTPSEADQRTADSEAAAEASPVDGSTTFP